MLSFTMECHPRNDRFIMCSPLYIVSNDFNDVALHIRNAFHKEKQLDEIMIFGDTSAKFRKNNDTQLAYTLPKRVIIDRIDYQTQLEKLKEQLNDINFTDINGSGFTIASTLSFNVRGFALFNTVKSKTLAPKVINRKFQPLSKTVKKFCITNSILLSDVYEKLDDLKKFPALIRVFNGCGNLIRLYENSTLVEFNIFYISDEKTFSPRSLSHFLLRRSDKKFCDRCFRFHSKKCTNYCLFQTEVGPFQFIPLLENLSPLVGYADFETYNNNNKPNFSGGGYVLIENGKVYDKAIFDCTEEKVSGQMFVMSLCESIKRWYEAKRGGN